jgi:phosphohistidine phosphatase SixA
MGRTTAAAMGKALRRLGVPIGEVLSSPTYRALETVRLLEVTRPTLAEELGDNGQSMQAVAEAQAAWLRKQVTLFPRATNTLLVTHMPNIARAFPAAGAVDDGETLVFGPDGKGGAAIVARVKIDEWNR